MKPETPHFKSTSWFLVKRPFMKIYLSCTQVLPSCRTPSCSPFNRSWNLDPAIESFNFSKRVTHRNAFYSQAYAMTEDLGGSKAWPVCERDLFGMVSSRDLFKGCWWPPTIGDKEFTAWITWGWMVSTSMSEAVFSPTMINWMPATCHQLIKKNFPNQPATGEQWKAGPLVFLGFFGDEILPSYVGIIITIIKSLLNNQYRK